MSNLVHTTRFCNNKNKSIDIKISNVVHTTRFCNNKNKSITTFDILISMLLFLLLQKRVVCTTFDILISMLLFLLLQKRVVHQICSKYFESQIIFKISLEAKNPKEFKQISQIRQLSPMPLGEIC
jgi:hypothetical protein